MEVSGTVLRHVSCPSFSRCVAPRGAGAGRVSVRPKTVTFCCSSGFSDEGHLQYYEEKKKKVTAVMSPKKKLKMLKSLYKGLSFSPELGFALDPVKQSLLGDDFQGNITSDAAEVLMTKLEQLRAEEKELKKKRKQEKKAKKRALRMNADPNCDESSSSSSSESSDSDCDNKVVDMNSLRVDVGVAVFPSTTTVDELQPQTLLHKTATTIVDNPGENAMKLCSRNNACVSSSSISLENENAVAFNTAPQKRIEVCMGNKCKKLGSIALMQEFEKVVGSEGAAAVVGCKCMGKCKSAPNVRIQNNSVDIIAEELNDSVKVPANPLLIGVGLEDVETIVARFLGDENLQDMGLAAAVST